MSTTRLSLATLAVFTLPLLTPACGRDDEDRPPPIPIRVAAVASATEPQPREPPRQPRAKGAAPDPQAAAPGPQPPAPGPAGPAGTQVPASSPFQIPWFPLPSSLPSSLPASLPTSFPQIPGLPALPAVPGFPLPNAPPPNAPPPNAPPPNTPPPSPSNVEPQGVAHVTVYGTKWCGPCKRLQSDLASRGVPYQFVDVEDSKAGQTPAGQRANEIPADMRGSVPVTRVRQRSGQTVWVRGADGARVEQAYRA